MEEDIFVKNLQDQSKKLQECQASHSLHSCMSCALFLECEVRKAYVKAVYESMNKGQEGNFDFN
ncbi:MAG: hypothetical protein IJ950_01050 [Helicobacter sp.]|uniref:hypothetical protein n=1 Tax=uncultured Helicobacter sp. TaxID=175537 RepID=UPI0037518311|nr:hypothetical protein [Helicobacter sp.]